MAKLTLNVSIQKKWWVMPLMIACKFAYIMRLLGEGHIDSMADLIGRRGFKIEVR